MQCWSLITALFSHVCLPATEAFFVLLYENARDKWIKQYEWKQDPENEGKNIPQPKKEQYNDPLYKTEYTVSNTGQNKYGGWSKKGLQRFVDLKQMIKEAKQKKNFAEIEQKALKYVQQAGGKLDAEGNVVVKEAKIDTKKPKENISTFAGDDDFE